MCTWRRVLFSLSWDTSPTFTSYTPFFYTLSLHQCKWVFERHTSYSAWPSRLILDLECWHAVSWVRLLAWDQQGPQARCRILWFMSSVRSVSMRLFGSVGHEVYLEIHLDLDHESWLQAGICQYLQLEKSALNRRICLPWRQARACMKSWWSFLRPGEQADPASAW